MTYEAFNQQDLKGTLKTFTDLREAKRYAKSVAGDGYDKGGIVRDANYISRAAQYHRKQGWDYSRCPANWAKR